MVPLQFLNRPAVIFSVKSYLSAIAALYIAFSMGLPNPFWCVITAYIVAQPRAGAVASKATYRVTGTLIGASVAVLMVPPLVQAPEVLSLALALWLGLCVFLATLDRTVRSYLFVMAGVTTCVIAFPSLTDPSAIFDVAIARVEEIVLGIVCATVVHMVVWPGSSTALLFAKVDATLTDALRWTADSLAELRPDALATERKQLAVSVNEVHDLITHASYESLAASARGEVFRALLSQLERLLPLSADLHSLLDEIEHSGGLSGEVARLQEDVRRWIADTNASYVTAQRLQARCAALTPILAADTSWPGVLQLCLLTRLAELTGVVRVCQRLHLSIHNCGSRHNVLPGNPDVGPRTVQRDYFAALTIAGSAALTLLAGNLLWIASGWSEGTNAVMMAGVFYVVYSGFGNPALALKNKFVGVVVRMGVGAIYVAAVLPAVEGFDMLAIVLAPVLIVCGILLTVPRFSPLAFNLVVGLSSPYIISAQFTNNLTGYLNNGLATLTGIGFALVVMTAVQPVWLGTAVHRLMNTVWNDIAKHRYKDIPRWRSRMVHRTALLLNQVVRSGADVAVPPFDVLRELQTGHLLAELSQSSQKLPRPLQTGIMAIVGQTSDHYLKLVRGGHQLPPANLRDEIDRMLAAGMVLCDGPEGRAFTVALASLRRNLFPVSPTATLAAIRHVDGKLG